MKEKGIIEKVHESTDIDYSTYIKEQEDKIGSEIACRKGCHNCCLNPTINVFQPEVERIHQYIHEELDEDKKNKILASIKKNEDFVPCPFLIEGECGIYLARPITCRIFNVFNKECELGEDPSITRPKDILKPSLESAKKTGYMIMEYYGITDKEEKERLFHMGFLYDKSYLAHELDWKKMMIK